MNRLMRFGFGLGIAVALGGLVLLASDEWDKQINNATRFKVQADFANQTVVDRETTLMWERSPDTFQFDWTTAHAHCNLLTVGNRKGWRLPTVQELATLVDPSVAPPGPTLPPGNPFMDVQVFAPVSPPGGSSAYWSANTWSGDPTVAWDVSFNTGVVANTSKSSPHYAWCVRGGSGVDIQ